MGRSEESKEQRKIKQREYYRNKYQTDPEFKAAQKLKQKRYRDANKEKCLERAREKYRKNKSLRDEQRKTWARNNKEKQLKTQREYYGRNKASQSRKIQEGKYRRDPTRGLTKAINEFRNGKLSFDELTRRYSDSLVRIDEIIGRAES